MYHRNNYKYKTCLMPQARSPDLLHVLSSVQSTKATKSFCK